MQNEKHICPLSQEDLTANNANEFILVKSNNTTAGQNYNSYYFIHTSAQNQFFGLDKCLITNSTEEYQVLYLTDLSDELKEQVIGLTDNNGFNPFFAKGELQSHIKTGSFQFKTIVTNPATTLEEFKNLLASYPLQKHAIIDPANNESLLRYFARASKKEFVEALITVGVSINNTNIHTAAENGEAEEVHSLITDGADINVKNNLDMSPLHYAVLGEHTETTTVLIKQGADINVKNNYGYTPLHYAAQKGHTAIVESLINAGAEKDAKNNYGYTPLHYAAQKGHTAIVQALIERNADIDAKDKHGKTPLHLAALKGHTATALALIDAGADIEAEDNHHWTPLHLAALKGQTATVLALIEKNAVIEAKDNHDWTPLNWAAAKGHTATALALITAGADIEAKGNHDWTPLHLASIEGHTEIVKTLIDAGADIETKDNNGRTPLYFAVSHGHTEIVKTLIDAGANINAKDNYDRTPFGIAKYSSKYKIALILILAKTKAFFSKNFVPIIIYISLVASLLLAAHLSPPLMLLLSGPVMGYLNCLNNLFFIVLVFDDYTNYSPRRYFFSDYLTHDELFFAFFVTGVPLFIAAFFSPSLEILLSGPMLLCSLPVIQVAILSLLSIPFSIALLNYFDRMDPEQGKESVSGTAKTTALGFNQLVVNAATPANTSKIRAAGAAEDLRSGIKAAG
jgi:ankyrin repeat protein